MKPRFIAARTAAKRNVIWDATAGRPANLAGDILVFHQDAAAETFAAILNVMNARGNMIRVPPPADAPAPRRKH